MSEYIYAMENLYKPTEPAKSGSVASKSTENTWDDRVTSPNNPNAVENIAQGGLEYRNSEFETIDLITLPTDPVKSTHDNSFTECYPQFVAILPGMQFLWSVWLQSVLSKDNLTRYRHIDSSCNWYATMLGNY